MLLKANHVTYALKTKYKDTMDDLLLRVTCTMALHWFEYHLNINLNVTGF